MLLANDKHRAERATFFGVFNVKVVEDAAQRMHGPSFSDWWKSKMRCQVAVVDGRLIPEVSGSGF